jgi:hypothetical protein
MRPSITAYGKGADRRTASLRQMTVDQLLDLGTSRVAYLRTGMWDGERLFALIGADGVPLATVDSVETAVEVAAEHGLAFISVH